MCNICVLLILFFYEGKYINVFIYNWGHFEPQRWLGLCTVNTSQLLYTFYIRVTAATFQCNSHMKGVLPPLPFSSNHETCLYRFCWFKQTGSKRLKPRVTAAPSHPHSTHTCSHHLVLSLLTLLCVSVSVTRPTVSPWRGSGLEEEALEESLVRFVNYYTIGVVMNPTSLSLYVQK